MAKYAVIDHASSGDNELVAAVTGMRIKVVALCIVAAGAVTARLESGAGGTALTGQMALPANGILVWPEGGWVIGDVGANLNLELGGAVSCDGCLVYEEIP